MTENIAIKVENLSKVYKLYDSPGDRMKEALHWRGKKYHKDFHALDDLSFEIKKGETVGIVGKNGSGKSTLLKIITGVLSPTSGKVTVNGRVSALLELGAGFNAEYTGLENVYFQGNLMGYSDEEMEAKLKPILEFADIGDFIHQPVKMYSSGMFARLAFAVAINVEPDILIVDEALSVGDAKFQNKCLSRIKAMQETGLTILFVSHSTAQVNAICTSAIWINSGVLVEQGDVFQVTSLYTYDQSGEARQQINQGAKTNEHSNHDEDQFKAPDDIQILLDTNDIKVLGYKLIDEQKFVNYTLHQSGLYNFIIKCKTVREVLHPLVGFGVYNTLDENIVHFNSENLHEKLRTINSDEEFIIQFTFELPDLRSGEYVIKIGIDDGPIGSNERLLHVVVGKFEYINKTKQGGYISVAANINIY
jgi:ABC-type polysaccharide/polyol phosphate transport system ATPase subunit